MKSKLKIFHHAANVRGFLAEDHERQSVEVLFCLGRVGEEAIVPEAERGCGRRMRILP